MLSKRRKLTLPDNRCGGAMCRLFLGRVLLIAGGRKQMFG